MDEHRLVDRCRSQASRFLIGLRIRLRRVTRRPVAALFGKAATAVRALLRFSLLGRLAGWVRRHPRWAAIELAGLLIAAVVGMPTVSRHADLDNVDETTLRFDDVEIHAEDDGGFADHDLSTSAQPKVMPAETSASPLEGPSLSGGPMLVPDPPTDPPFAQRTTRYRPVTAAAATRPVSRSHPVSERTNGTPGAWLTGTIESAEPAARTAGRIQFNPIRRQ